MFVPFSRFINSPDILLFRLVSPSMLVAFINSLSILIFPDMSFRVIILFPIVILNVPVPCISIIGYVFPVPLTLMLFVPTANVFVVFVTDFEKGLHSNGMTKDI